MASKVVVPAEGYTLVRTGVKVQLPKGTCGRSTTVASLALRGVETGAAVIERDLVRNQGHKDYVMRQWLRWCWRRWTWPRKRPNSPKRRPGCPAQTTSPDLEIFHPYQASEIAPDEENGLVWERRVGNWHEEHWERLGMRRVDRMRLVLDVQNPLKKVEVATLAQDLRGLREGRHRLRNQGL